MEWTKCCLQFIRTIGWLHPLLFFMFFYFHGVVLDTNLFKHFFTSCNYCFFIVLYMGLGNVVRLYLFSCYRISRDFFKLGLGENWTIPKIGLNFVCQLFFCNVWWWDDFLNFFLFACQTWYSPFCICAITALWLKIIFLLLYLLQYRNGDKGFC